MGVLKEMPYVGRQSDQVPGGEPAVSLHSGKRACILVLDGDQVSALTVVRSLLKQQYLLHVASSVSNPLAGYSRGVSQRVCYPDPLQNEEAFLAWLALHLSTCHYDLIMPVTERTLVPISLHRSRFPGARFAMADAESLRQVLDKAETFKLASRLGIAVPTSTFLNEPGELAGVLASLSFPVVVKPSHSISALGIGYGKRNVSYAKNAEELRIQCEQCLVHSPVLLQSWFKGQGVGIELIAKDGDILYAFQHVRLHEVPLTGGGSSFRVSAALEPELLREAGLLIRALRWNGVAMVEFKWDPESRRSCLMEVNGRFWGSLPLAVAAGADFPAMQAEFFLTGSVKQSPSYRIGVYCRNLARDLIWHELVLRQLLSGRKQQSVLGGPPRALSVLRDLLRVFSPRHNFDTQDFLDPVPGIVEINRIVGSYVTRLRGVITGSLYCLHQRWLWRSGAVTRRLRAARSVLFVCYGNINRSALAEVVMESLLPANCNKQVLSAGFHREEERPVDERMRALGSQRGFDLSRCRSNCITCELVQGSDIIFVMEKAHRDRLLEACPDSGKKVFLLGAVSTGTVLGNAEILDPYNQGEAVYRSCFLQIHQAVVCLTDVLQAGHGTRK